MYSDLADIMRRQSAEKELALQRAEREKQSEREKLEKEMQLRLDYERRLAAAERALMQQKFEHERSQLLSKHDSVLTPSLVDSYAYVNQQSLPSHYAVASGQAALAQAPGSAFIRLSAQLPAALPPVQASDINTVNAQGQYMRTVGFQHENANFSGSSVHNTVTVTDVMPMNVSVVRPPPVPGADGLALLAAAAAQTDNDMTPAPAPSASAMFATTTTMSVITDGLHTAVPSVYGQSVPAYSTTVHQSTSTELIPTASAANATLAVPSMSAPVFTALSGSMPTPAYTLPMTLDTSAVYAGTVQSVLKPGYSLPSSAPAQSYTQPTAMPVQPAGTESMSIQSVFTSDQSTGAESTVFTPAQSQVTPSQYVPATAVLTGGWTASTPVSPTVTAANQPLTALTAIPVVNTSVSAANVSSNVEHAIVSTTAMLDGNSNATALSPDEKNKLFVSSDTKTGAVSQINETVSTVADKNVSAVLVQTNPTKTSQSDETVSEKNKLTASSQVNSKVATHTNETSTPLVVVKQLQVPKSYNGKGSWKAFQKYFERIAVVNGWTTDREKL